MPDPTDTNPPADAGEGTELREFAAGLGDFIQKEHPELGKETPPPKDGPSGPVDGEIDEDGGASGPSGPEEPVEGASGPQAGPTGAEAGEGASGAQAGATGPTGSLPRDKDLEDIMAKVDPHTRPQTKKVIVAYKLKVSEARTERDAERARAEDLAAKLKVAEEKASGVTLPEEAKKTIEQLQNRIRELDISQDPTLVQKYDARITGNNDEIIKVLTQFGLGKTDDGKDDPSAVADLKRMGLTLKNLKPHLDKLESEGFDDEAEAIREMVRDNQRLARDKNLEVENWKKDYGTRTTERTKTQQAESEKTMGMIRAEGEKELGAGIAALAKDFAFINRPAEPLATDADDVAKAKRSAIAEYDAAATQVQEAVKAFNASGLAPDKAAVATGKLTAAAVQYVILKNHVLPRIKKDLEAKDARLKQLEADLGKFRKQGGVNRAHAAAITAPGADNTPAAPAGESVAEGLARIARAGGIRTDT